LGTEVTLKPYSSIVARIKKKVKAHKGKNIKAAIFPN
jgi:hypothetical protein